MATPEERLAELGLALPEVVPPLAAYVPAVRTGDYVYTSGQLPLVKGELGVTGLLMWFNAWTTEYLTGRVLTIALLLHTFEAFLALLHVGIIHMVGVIFSPIVFPLSPAMFSGNTPTEEMVEAHPAMLERVAKQLSIEPAPGENHG